MVFKHMAQGTSITTIYLIDYNCITLNMNNHLSDDVLRDKNGLGCIVRHTTTQAFPQVIALDCCRSSGLTTVRASTISMNDNIPKLFDG